MSATLQERPAPPRSPGLPARRAVIRWAVRLLRREWRQQLLILALITVAVAATVVAATVAVNTPAPAAGTLGAAQDAATLAGSPASVQAQVSSLQRRFGAVEVIRNESLPIPGTTMTFDLRGQSPRLPFGSPLVSLVSGRYPASSGETAVTGGVAAAFKLSAGSRWTLDGVTRTVTGIVANPQSLLDEFALVLPGQVTAPTTVTALFDAPGVPASSLGRNVVTADSLANANVINPQTISVAAAVLGMLLVALVGVGGFTTLAQRRLRAIGMLAAQGATQRHIRLVIWANGLATGLAGAVAGAVLGFLAWLAYRPAAENSAHHLMGVFALPWTVVGVTVLLAVVAACFAASRPAKAISRIPTVAALSGRPPEPRKTRHLAIPVGIGFGVATFLLLGLAGAGSGNGGGLIEVAAGFLCLAVAIVLLAPACLSLVARLGRRSPVSVRLALRDLARYRARSGPALAAISLASLIAVVICLASTARYGNVLDYAGPNLSSSQLVVDTPAGPYGGLAPGPGGKAPAPPTAAQQAAAARTAQRIAAEVGSTNLVTLEWTSASLSRDAAGRNWSGPVFVATPQLLRAFGISPGSIHPDADILTMRPGLSGISHMVLTYGTTSGLPNPVIQEVGQLPSGTSAPNTVITQHAISRLHLQSSVGTAGWLITVPGGLNAAQVNAAQQTAAAAGLSVETRNSVPSLTQITDVATLFGLVLALGIVGLSVGLVRSESARDLRTLTATGAGGATRRMITAATAGALALTGAVIGTAGGYLAMTGYLRSAREDGLSSLGTVPVASLLWILAGLPLVAMAAGWLLAGRQPAALGRQPLE